MSTSVRKKIPLCTTVSPYISKKVNRLVEEQEFSSASDLVSMALSEFLQKFPDKKKVII
jgi:Arc/MetJ-type ribon-helix-helix transcriptional regulator